MIFSANSVHLIILCIICYHQRESIVTCEIVVIRMNSRSIVLICIKSLLLFNHCLCTFDFFFTFVSCLLTVALHIADICNKYYLLTTRSVPECLTTGMGLSLKLPSDLCHKHLCTFFENNFVDIHTIGWLSSKTELE